MARANDLVYSRVLKPLFMRLEAERAHRLTLAILARLPSRAPTEDPPELRTTLWGVSFSNPVGLAAGADKNAVAIRAWNSLGFGFAEIGTITPLPQPGNPPPRMWRLEEHRALINRLGFPSEGMEAVEPRITEIRRKSLKMRLGLNFGPNKNTVPAKVAADYAALTSRMAHLADFVVVNISSPNTPGLREWQAPERIRAIVDTIRTAPVKSARRPPLLIKLSPDLDDAMLREICAAAIDLAIDGIVATNTTIARHQVGVDSSFEGGLSGEPLKDRALQALRNIREYTSGKIPLVAVGGIASAEDAYERIRAGASLVEFYTGLIYRGPGLVDEIKQGLVRLLIRDGFRSISEAIGIGAK